MTSISSKKKKPATKKIKFSDGTVKEVSANAAGVLKKRETGINQHPPEKQITEIPTPEATEPDEYDKLEFPPPLRDKVFREIWGRGIDQITKRENFNVNHLGLFETYCNLITNMRRLEEFIIKNGHTFRVVTHLGETRRTCPEVFERNKAISQIANYAKMLDLVPNKETLKRTRTPKVSEWD